MPGNLAFMGMSKAEKIESQYSYDKWYLGGHSLGGAMAAAFAEKNSDKIDGLIFFAAYSANDLTKCQFPVLIIDFVETFS